MAARKHRPSGVSSNGSAGATPQLGTAASEPNIPPGALSTDAPTFTRSARRSLGIGRATSPVGEMVAVDVELEWDVVDDPGTVVVDGGVAVGGVEVLAVAGFVAAGDTVEGVGAGLAGVGRGDPRWCPSTVIVRNTVRAMVGSVLIATATSVLPP